MHSVGWSPDGAHLATADDTGLVIVWDRQLREVASLLLKPSQCLAWSAPLIAVGQPGRPAILELRDPADLAYEPASQTDAHRHTDRRHLRAFRAAPRVSPAQATPGPTYAGSPSRRSTTTAAWSDGHTPSRGRSPTTRAPVISAEPAARGVPTST